MRGRLVHARDRGGGGIEMAIILPLLLFCVFGIAHLGMYYLARQAALSVAQVAVEGERAWLAEPGAGERRAQRFLDQLPAVLTDPQIQLTNDGEQVTATVTGNTVSIIPWLRHSVEQTAAGPVERLT
jgi:Flp pilus assembly protein TadG